MQNEPIQQEEAVKKPKFNVISVEKASPPEGMPGDNWHRYIIGQGGSKIEGIKPGTLKAVTLHAETIAEDLNSRAGRGGSTYAPRKKA
ncbi:MAG: hypothetical protein R6X06_10685 [Gammaproteobacteria bacterium]